MKCTPENPLGAPMVSSEGACAAYYHYGRRQAIMTEFNLSCPVPRVADDRIVLAHGGGGRLTHQLIENIFLPAFGNPCSNSGTTAPFSRSTE